MRTFLAFVILLFTLSNACAQGCCSGGSGSPIAGGASQGVLFEQQAEVAVNYQHTNTHKFFTGDQKINKLFDAFNSNYLYLRVAYGVSQKLTMSVETGYFFNKTQIGLNRIDTFKSSGTGDLILFPRYNVYSKNTEKHRNEITVGLGYKIPIGACDDSTLMYTNPVTGKKSFTVSPPTVQVTNGSNDVIFYGFCFRGYRIHSTNPIFSIILVRSTFVGWKVLHQQKRFKCDPTSTSALRVDRLLPPIVNFTG